MITMPDWRIHNVRMTVFITPEFKVPTALWRDCVGDEPESSAIQRATATRTETGSFAEGELMLQIQPIRIDWNYGPAGPPAKGLPVLGPFPDAAEPLLSLVHRWAASNAFPETRRIALGWILVSKTADRVSGYKELATFIDGVPTRTDASDFQYQINIARDSHVEVPGLRLNRLSRWSVNVTRIMAFSFGPNVQSGPGPIFSPEPEHQVRLELDINTHPDFQGLIPRDKIPAIIDDLFEGAKEVAREGAR